MTHNKKAYEFSGQEDTTWMSLSSIIVTGAQTGRMTPLKCSQRV